MANSIHYRLLGHSGLRVSELCLGCATFGTNWGAIGSDKEESQRIFKAFLDAGGNFIDTSNRYQEEMSEEYLGEFIPGVRRDGLVLASKYSLFDKATESHDPNGCGNHRKNLMRSVEGSLRRLKTDYIDLLWVHIWDITTPMEEILRSLDDLVRMGKVLYIGASNFPAWWIARANTIAELKGWTPFIATQIEYSMVERSCEPEFLPMAHELDLGLVCWSALGGGMTTGKYNRGRLDQYQPHRLTDELDPRKNHYWHAVAQRNLAIMDEVVKVADEIGHPPAQVSLRWLMQQKVVTIPIFSARTLDQLKEDLGCLNFELTSEQIEKLNRASIQAISSIRPEAGPYPYPMLEYGSPSLPEFYSRRLLFADFEDRIINHRRVFPFHYQPDRPDQANRPDRPDRPEKMNRSKS